VFVFGVFFHFAFVTVLKYHYSPGFCQQNQKLKKVFHVLTQLAIPSPYKDWDEIDEPDVMASYIQVEKVEIDFLKLFFIG
jgi:hypothetical protein